MLGYLFYASVSKLPNFEKAIDKIIDINTFQFWEDTINYLKEIKNCMANNGVITIFHLTRKPGDTEQDSIDAENKFSKMLQKADFNNVRIENNESSFYILRFGTNDL